MPRARVTSKGQLTIPKEIRDSLAIEPGDYLDFHIEDGHVQVTAVRRRRLDEFRGLFPVSHALPFREERERARKAHVSAMRQNNNPDA
jgi:antitoxin PrlF